MDYKIEMIPVPVTDVDRAKNFYTEKLGFTVDVDHTAGENFRFVQLTPPGSACSIGFGINVSQMKPGDLKGIQLVVENIKKAREDLLARGAEVSPIYHFGENGQEEGPGEGWNAFISIKDPDNNQWVYQQRG